MMPLPKKWENLKEKTSQNIKNPSQNILRGVFVVVPPALQL
jgi:hypothetical protein